MPQQNRNIDFSPRLSEQHSLWRNCPNRAPGASFLGFLNHKQGHITVARTPLDEGSACRRDLYLTTHNPRGIRTRNPSKRTDPRLRPLDHWYRHQNNINTEILDYKVRHTNLLHGQWRKNQFNTIFPFVSLSLMLPWNAICAITFSIPVFFSSHSRNKW